MQRHQFGLSWVHFRARVVGKALLLADNKMFPAYLLPLPSQVFMAPAKTSSNSMGF